MTSDLHLADDFALPAEAVTQTFAILAKRGAGKTYTALVLVEELLAAGLPVVVVDPVGVTWGLRASADGSGPGLPIVVLGGDHGDLPLETDAGAAIADLIADDGVSCVLDLSLLRKGESTRFMTDFAERLYHRNRRPLHLVLDEADAWAPQRPLPGQQRLLGAVEDLVRRGRARGLGVTLVTQRAAVVNKDVLTQVEVLVALRTIAPQDRDAIDAWIRVHGTPEQREQLMTSLPSLPIGEAWFWSPGWLDVFRRVRVRRRRTFDSSATPKVGETLAQPRALAAVDLDALRSKLAATIEQAAQADPAALRRRIAELERSLKATRSGPATVERVVERVEVPVVSAELVRELSDATDALRSAGMRVIDAADGIKAALVGARALPPAPVQREVRPAPAPTLSPRTQPVAPASDVRLGKAERAILTVLAQYPGGRTKTQVAILTGYAVGGGGFGNAIGALRSRGLLAGSKESLQITPDGLALLIEGSWEPLPTGAALLDYWCQQLGRAERLILQELAEVYPRTMNKIDLAAATGYEPTGGGFGNALSRLRTLELIEGRTELRASDVFFDGARR